LEESVTSSGIPREVYLSSGLLRDSILTRLEQPVARLSSMLE
jgi:hypothetical protein